MGEKTDFTSGCAEAERGVHKGRGEIDPKGISASFWEHAPISRGGLGSPCSQTLRYVGRLTAPSLTLLACDWQDKHVTASWLGESALRLLLELC